MKRRWDKKRKKIQTVGLNRVRSTNAKSSRHVLTGTSVIWPLALGAGSLYNMAFKRRVLWRTLFYWYCFVFWFHKMDWYFQRVLISSSGSWDPYYTIVFFPQLLFSLKLTPCIVEDNENIQWKESTNWTKGTYLYHRARRHNPSLFFSNWIRKYCDSWNYACAFSQCIYWNR